MKKIGLIIPCYNEEFRLKTDHIKFLVENSDTSIYLVNDGSTDNTVKQIQNIVNCFPNRCFIINYQENSGKANTIFKAIQEIKSQNSYDFIGYFDADFSTPPQEIIRLLNICQSSDSQFLFGSRILILNSLIERKTYRHFIGRAIITLINIKYKLGIYDTQCGAKIFNTNIINKVFTEKFYTSWLFDVEIFIRLKKQNCLKFGLEIPLKQWKDVDGSKLGLKSSFKILKELVTLYQKY